MLFIVTDFCYGGDLFEYILERNKISEQEVYMVMKQCISAIVYIHTKNICHRDLKLENIMLQNIEDLTNLKLIDFGLSKNLQKNMTMKSMCSGSPLYIAPETIAGIVSLNCDMWSIGVVMYVLLTGKFPFQSESIEQIFDQIMTKPIDIINDPELASVSVEGKDLLS